MYKKAVLGGTFDHFHIGHQAFLDAALEQSEQVTIGLAKQTLFQKKFLASTIENHEIRHENLTNYLEKKQYLKRATIIPIEDIFGNTLTDKDINAIFVTEETQAAVEIINSKREELNFPKLLKIVVPFVKSSDGGIISSERIRAGEIDRQGFVYQTVFEQKETFVLPDDLRSQLQKPFGTLVKDTAAVLPFIKDKTVIAVGDIIVKALKDEGIEPAQAVIDFRTRRHELPKLEIEGIKATNKPGTINSNAALALQKALQIYLQSNSSQTLIVDGEEDLLTLPAILFAPLESIVLYGQFDQGVVINEVTEDLKQTIVTLLKKFQ
jgi:cytidyltransferase-like protein